jgi:hypothetical protein
VGPDYSTAVINSPIAVSYITVLDTSQEYSYSGTANIVLPYGIVRVIQQDPATINLAYYTCSGFDTVDYVLVQISTTSTS